MLGNVFILGDSYSTFYNYIPKGYAYYYDEKGPYYLKTNSKMKLSDNDVCDVTHTWWYGLVKENGTLLKNCSWSGSTICNTGYNGSDNSKISFIARFEKFLKNGYFEENSVDTFFLFGGTNDSWANSPLGNKIYADWASVDLYNVFPAFSYLIHMITSNLPHTKIYCIINTPELKTEISKFYKFVCEKNDVEVIELHNIDKVHGHPTIKRMKEIKEQILDYIESKR